MSKPWRMMLFTFAALLVLAAFPHQPAHADLVYFQSVDDSDTEFGAGELQLTSLARGEEPDGQAGSVTLATLGALNLSQNASPMPLALEGAGAARVGNFIFVVGGSTTDLVNPLSARVFRTRIDPANGSQVDLDPNTAGDQFWLEDDSMPAARHSTQFSNETAPRAYAAVASVTTDANAGNGFLYVIGGRVKLPVRTFELSSNSVLRATVQNGEIVNGSWTKMNELPNGALPRTTVLTSARNGYEAAATFVAVSGGKTFLYLIGGRQVFDFSGTVQRFGSEQVFYTQVDPATGNFVRPNGEANKPVWVSAETGTDGIGSRINDGTGAAGTLPGPGSGSTTDQSGLWHTAVVGGQLTTTATSQNFLMILGGQTREDASNSFTSKVFKARINTNGTLTWVRSGGAAGATLRDARNGHGAVLFRQIAYVVGGRASGGSVTQDDDIGTGALNSSLELNEIQTGQFFVLSPSGLQGPGPRRYAPMILIPSSTDPSLAYTYLIGGRKMDPNDANVSLGPTTEVLRAEIGKPSSIINYPSEGWYVSRAYPVAIGSINNLQVRSVKWIFTAPAGTQVQVEYRIGPFPNCTGLPETWLDAGTSGNFQLPNDATSRGNCFQYRARLVTNNPAQTPVLLRAGIEIEVPGAPDLTFPESVASRFPGVKNTELITNTENAPTDLKITMVNSNLYADPTRGTGFGGSGENSIKGTFFVDLFAYPCPQAQQPPSPFHAIPIQVDPVLPCNFAYTQIDRSVMTAERALTLSRSTLWCDPNQSGCVNIDMLAPFSQAGVYTVVVVLDSSGGTLPTIGLVDEQPNDAGKAESNNIFSTTITIAKEPTAPGPDRRTAFLPVIVRPSSQ